MLRVLGFFFLFHSVGSAFAGTVSGTIKDINGTALPFSSILVKGSTVGVSANAQGYYHLPLDEGSYTLICQYIGYATVEKNIKIKTSDTITVDFILSLQQYLLKEVTVKSGGEDPAYAIIRHAIEKRVTHLNEIKQFQAEVYLKGQLQLRNFPDRFFGQKVDFEDGDSSKRKMLFLSETVASYSVDGQRKQKIEVLSTRVSGRSDAFGFSRPQIISFYENTVQLGSGLNPRGFISPIANGALNFYRYKFEGTYYENGIEINRIKVIPKRKYEPLFSGYIHIIENEWRIHSLQLNLLQEQQMQLLDTLTIEQLYVPTGSYWVIKNQVLYPSGKFFGFDFFGSFLQVYDKFNLTPSFQKKFFNNTLIKFYDSANKKSVQYWDSVRPLPLLPEELRDYKKKDSLEQVRKDPRYMDSIDRKRNRISIAGILLTGQSFSKQRKKETININSLFGSLNYNTVEGGVLKFSPSYTKTFEGRRSLQITPEIRWGLANKRLNLRMQSRYRFGKKYFNSVRATFGRGVFQYNNEQPISERSNTLATLWFERNHMKIYQADFFQIAYNTGVGGGVNLNVALQYQNRKSLQNLADLVAWKDRDNVAFTPNYPIEQLNAPMPENIATTLTLGAVWQPGGKYIELPDRKIAIGSDYPTFRFMFTKAFKGLMGSDADFAKWKLTMEDDVHLKLAGRLDYQIAIGGFLQTKKIFLPDYQHFNGNQTVVATNYLNSFQLLPYYQHSNLSDLYGTLHAEYHLNGLLTNKIPGFKKLNWFLVMSANMLHIRKGISYYEAMMGIENILKIFRVDYIQGFEGGNRRNGIRVAIPFFLGLSND